MLPVCDIVRPLGPVTERDREHVPPAQIADAWPEYMPRDVLHVPLRLQAAASDTVAMLRTPAIERDIRLSFIHSSCVGTGRRCWPAHCMAVTSPPFFAPGCLEKRDL
jgi:hypothetical protein